MSQQPSNQQPAPLSAQDLLEVYGPATATWLEQGLVATGDPDERVEVRSGDDLLGWIEPSDEFPGRPVFKAAVAVKDNGKVRGIPFPAGFIPERPEQARDQERRRWSFLPS